MTDSNITDMTILILRDIRDDIRGTNARLDMTNERLDALTREVHTTNERLDVTNERLTVVEHTVNEAADQIRSVVRYVKDKQDKDIESLRKRVTRLEAKART